MKKKSKFDKVAVVKSMSRDRIGAVPATKVREKKKPARKRLIDRELDELDEAN